MITVTLVEDDSDIRSGLAFLINGTSGYRCIATFGDCFSAIQSIPTQIPDVVLMDIELPGMSGIDGIKALKDKVPHLDIIVLTVHENDDLVFNALCAGACGYLIKETPPARLLEAIREVKDGGSPMSKNIARKVVNSFKVKPPDNLLTARETEILNGLCQSLNYKTIAANLFISEQTVRVHLKNIYRKLEVHSKAEAVAKAFREKLVL